MVDSILDFIYNLVGNETKVVSDPITVPFLQFPKWFDEQMLTRMPTEFQLIEESMDQLGSCIYKLQLIIDDLKLHIPQSQLNSSNKLQKLLEQFDVVFSILQIKCFPSKFNEMLTAMRDAKVKFDLKEVQTKISSMFPDSSTLKDITSKIRTKLKAIDESLSSKGLLQELKQKNITINIAALKISMNDLLSTVDLVEKNMIKRYTEVTDYLETINSKLYEPMNAFIEKISILGKMKSLSDELKAKHAALIKLDDEYEQIRGNELLSLVLKKQREAILIEKTVDEMLLPIKSLTSKIAATVLSKKSSSPRPMVSHSIYFLAPILEKNIKEILTYCADK